VGVDIFEHRSRPASVYKNVPTEVDTHVPPCPTQNHPVNSMLSTGAFTLEIVRVGLSAEGGFFTELIFEGIRCRCEHAVITKVQKCVLQGASELSCCDTHLSTGHRVYINYKTQYTKFLCVVLCFKELNIIVF
jgi:hypothetical protein